MPIYNSPQNSRIMCGTLIGINPAFPAHVGDRRGARRCKRDEHDERSDSPDVVVTDVDEAALPSPSLLLPLLAPAPFL